MFEDLNKALREGQERWEEIEKRSERLREHLSSGKKITMESSLNDLAWLVLHLVDHMRPMNPSKDQLSDATKGLADLLNALKK
jgi:predicted  nucleic acid-binding Zn-ribbon protein